MPNIVKKYYSNLVWDLPNDDNTVYLTFDDGPTPEITEWVLDTLNKYSIKATFFCIGKNVIQYPDVFQRIINEGHAVGNHTYDHLKGWKTDTNTYIENVQKCEDVFQSKLFRPPYGKIKKKQAAKLSEYYSMIMWDVLSGDFNPEITPEKCYKNITNNVKSGSIIVFHDSLKASRNLKVVLPKTIDYMMKEGFQFDAII